MRTRQVELSFNSLTFIIVVLGVVTCLVLPWSAGFGGSVSLPGVLAGGVGLLAMLVAQFRFFARRGSVSVAFASALVLMTFWDVMLALFDAPFEIMGCFMCVGAVMEFVRFRQHSGGRWAALAAVALATALAGVFGGKEMMAVAMLVNVACSLLSGSDRCRSAIAALVAGAIGGFLWAVSINVPVLHCSVTLNSAAVDGEFPLLIGSLPYTLFWFLALVGAVFGGVPTRAEFHEKLSEAMGSECVVVSVTAVVATVAVWIVSGCSCSLLPMYPFVAWLTALLLRHTVNNNPLTVKVYGWTLVCVGVICPVVWLLVAGGVIPELGIGLLRAVKDGAGMFSVLLCCLSVASSLGLVRTFLYGGERTVAQWTLVLTVILNWFLVGAVMVVLGSI